MCASGESIQSLQEQLAKAQQRLDKAVKVLGTKGAGRESEFLAASTELLSLERQLAEAKGEEYACPIDFPVKWDTGAPLPHLLMNDYRTFLTFCMSEPDPNWDGTYVNVRNPAKDTAELLALVTFSPCACAKLGTPNDEVLHGHPLMGKGLEGYAAQEVRNSNWLKELEAINSVHAMYDPSRWTKVRHYIFPFHDSTFECVAESYKVELFKGTMRELLAEVSERLVS